MFSYLQKLGLEPIVVNQPLSKYRFQGKKFYDTGKMRYNSMITSLITRKGATYYKNKNIDFFVLGGIGGGYNRVISSVDKTKVECYLEDDFLVLMGEKRYYLEQKENNTFAYCHQDIYKPQNCLITKGEIGQLGKTESINATIIEELLQKLKKEGYQEKTTPEKWRWMHRFFMLNAGARQNKGVIRKVKITEPKEFDAMQKYGLSFGNLISQNTEIAYAESIEEIIIVDSYASTYYKKAPKLFENFPNLRILKLQKVYHLEAVDFDLAKMSKLRELSIGELGSGKLNNSHRLKSLPKNLFESKSLLKVFIPETERLQLTEEERQQLRNMCIQNSYLALASKDKKDRVLALAVLVEYQENPLAKEVVTNSIFVINGKLKGFTAKTLKEKLEAGGFEYSENLADLSNHNAIAIVGDQPSTAFIEKAISMGAIIALGGMFQNFLRDLQKQQKVAAGEDLGTEMKESLGQLLSNTDKANIELGLTLSSSKEIQSEIHAIDELTTEWLMLATLADDVKIRNKSKAQLKKNADYEVNNFLKNIWHGRKKKSEIETVEAFEQIIEHPALDKYKVLAGLCQHFKKQSNHYYTQKLNEIVNFTIRKKIAKFLPQTVLQDTDEIVIDVNYLDWNELNLFKNLEKLHISNWQDNKPKDFAIPNKKLVFPKLKILGLSSLALKTISSDFSCSDSLEQINLSYNQLEQFPDFILNLPNLKSINLVENELDSLPLALGDLKNLEVLNLRTATKEGYLMEDELLAKIVALPKLKRLELPEFRNSSLLKKIVNKKYFELRIPRSKRNEDTKQLGKEVYYLQYY